MAKITLLGTVGADAKVKPLENDRLVINFSVAENSSSKNKGGDFVEFTQWFNVSYFSRSEKLAKHILKGKKVFVTGTFRIGEFVNSTTGEVMRTVEIIADYIEPAVWEQVEEKQENDLSFLEEKPKKK
jgi:single stranded DNA-binding protein